jgi:hypothetical protein
MDRLETLVRDVLAEHADDAPPADGLLDGVGRRRRRLLAALTAAAVVIAVAVGIVVFRPGHDATAPAGPPPGTKAVSYHGITLYVPRDLPARNWVGCGDPLPAFALLRSVDYLVGCHAMPNPPPRPPRVPRRVRLLVQLSLYPRGAVSGIADTTVSIDGVVARTGYGALQVRDLDLSHSGALLIPSLDVSLVVSAPSRTAVAAVLDTVRVTVTDARGCAGRTPAFAPVDNAPTPTIVPGHPSSVVQCEYELTEDRAGGRFLRDSGTFGGAVAKRLATYITSLPAFRTSLPSARAPRGAVDRLIFRYADGTQHVVVLGSYTSPVVVTDGKYAVLDQSGHIDQILPLRQ